MFKLKMNKIITISPSEKALVPYETTPSHTEWGSLSTPNLLLISPRPETCETTLIQRSDFDTLDQHMIIKDIACIKQKNTPKKT